MIREEIKLYYKFDMICNKEPKPVPTRNLSLTNNTCKNCDCSGRLMSAQHERKTLAKIRAIRQKFMEPKTGANESNTTTLDPTHIKFYADMESYVNNILDQSSSEKIDLSKLFLQLTQYQT